MLGLGPRLEDDFLVSRSEMDFPLFLSSNQSEISAMTGDLIP